MHEEQTFLSIAMRTAVPSRSSSCPSLPCSALQGRWAEAKAHLDRLRSHAQKYPDIGARLAECDRRIAAKAPPNHPAFLQLSDHEARAASPEEIKRSLKKLVRIRRKK